MEIISASRRTDIPAFFPQWFINKLYDGYFDRVNPFNPKQVKRISLSRQDVAAFVFWTKEPSPFLSVVDDLMIWEYFFVFQYTLNDYPSFLEPNLPELARKIATFQELSKKLGKDRVLWRYDPILLSSETPVSYHLEKIHQLAELLSDVTDRLTISLYDVYRKSEKRLKQLSRELDLALYSDYDQHLQMVHELVEGITNIAWNYDLQLYSCSDRTLTERGIKPGACVDGNLISKYNGQNHRFSRDKNQRDNCLCSKSVDMGQYDTCSHFCRYCYAYTSEQKVKNNLNWKYHDNSPRLL